MANKYLVSLLAIGTIFTKVSPLLAELVKVNTAKINFICKQNGDVSTTIAVNSEGETQNVFRWRSDISSLYEENSEELCVKTAGRLNKHFAKEDFASNEIILRYAEITPGYPFIYLSSEDYSNRSSFLFVPPDPNASFKGAKNVLELILDESLQDALIEYRTRYTLEARIKLSFEK